MEFLLDFSVLVGILGILDYNSRRIARRFVRRGAETRPSFPKERKFDIGLEWIVYIYIYICTIIEEGRNVEGEIRRLFFAPISTGWV